MGGAELSSPSSPLPNSLFRQVTPLLQGARARGQGDQRNMCLRYFVLWGMEWEGSPLYGVGAWASTCSPTWPCWIWARAGQHRLQLGGASMPVPPTTLPPWRDAWSPIHFGHSYGCQPALEISQSPYPDLEEMLTKTLIVWPAYLCVIFK